jgi:hypothetical protein
MGGTLFAVRSASEPPLIAPDLEQFVGCELPCWNGIHPNETSIARANRILGEAGYTLEAPANTDVVFYRYQPPIPQTCAVQLDVRDTIVRRIRLEQCPPTRIGDLIRVLGAPSGVLVERSGLAFADGIAIAFLFPGPCDRIYKPDAFVGTIDLRTEDVLRDYLQPWRGFLDGQYYLPNPQMSIGCQL